MASENLFVTWFEHATQQHKPDVRIEREKGSRKLKVTCSGVPSALDVTSGGLAVGEECDNAMALAMLFSKVCGHMQGAGCRQTIRRGDFNWADQLKPVAPPPLVTGSSATAAAVF